jgi:DNA repair ATPase RecN
MNAIAEVAGKRDEARARAEAKYVELLNDDTTMPAQLDEILRELGKTPADAAVDHQTLRKAEDLQRRIDAAKGLGAKVDKSIADVKAYQQETQRILHDRKTGLGSLMQAQRCLTDQGADANRAWDELEALRKRHPALFRG